jgi:hypothetical protein
MRVIFGCIAAALLAALGGLIMGEYRLVGVMAVLAGLLFGLAVAEVAITVGRSSDWPLVGVTAAAAAVGFTWAAWIEAGRAFGPISAVRWVGSLAALASAGFWVRSLGSRAVRSPYDEEPLGAEPTE